MVLSSRLFPFTLRKVFCRRLGFVSDPTAEASTSTSSSSSATFATWLRSTMSVMYTLWNSPLRYSSLSDARWYESARGMPPCMTYSSHPSSEGPS